MVNAIVLLEVKRAKINLVAQDLADLDGISEVYSVAGRYDLVAVLRVRDNDTLAELVTERMHQVKYITGTETLIAFRAYSQHDLAGMFSIGLD